MPVRRSSNHLRRLHLSHSRRRLSTPVSCPLPALGINDRIPIHQETGTEPINRNRIGAELGQRGTELINNAASVPCCTAAVNRMRSKIKFFYMDPVQKWKTKHYFPWKLFIQIVKIIFVTIQVRSSVCYPAFCQVCCLAGLLMPKTVALVTICW